MGAFAVRRRLATLALAVAFASAACGTDSAGPPGDVPNVAAAPALLAGLALATANVGPRAYRVAIADSPASRSRGLAGTDDLGPLDGLLFSWTEPVETSFWMRGVTIPLDIVFVGADGRVLTRLTMPICAADPCPTYTSPAPFRWALETPAGGLDGVVAGDRISITPE